jgi:16S rRNA (guanine966-N2)-methyltransferase
MLRITGGRLARRKLKAPAGRGTRPTADRVKEALFNILGQELVGARVLDLYAGSGALGLEALSRGAFHCVLVENSPKALAVIRHNIAGLDLAASCGLIKGDVARSAAVLAEKGPFDLILADPPYETGQVDVVTAEASGWLDRDGVLIIEHSPHERPNLTKVLDLFDHRAYGQTELSFIRLAG